VTGADVKKEKGLLGRLLGGKTRDTAAADPAGEAETQTAAAEAPVGWFQRLKAGLSKTSSRLSEGITSIVSKRKLDEATLEELEELLIGADLGVETSSRITGALAQRRLEKGISSADVREVLASEIKRVLEPVARPLAIDDKLKPHVILVVGVNGTGKTTTIGKLAAKLARDGKKVMLAAGDTFRAAAIDQLKIWGERTGAPVVARDVGSDASALAFDALTQARDGGFDVLLLDTAGRLQNKEALMGELEKVVRVLKKLDPAAPHSVLLVLDATTGQNALSQVEVFRQKAGVTGLVMTKLDGTARGGILVAIAAKHGLPVHAIGLGEGVDDLQPFDAAEFSNAIVVD
jgi:fused signal recognition particle receptor